MKRWSKNIQRLAVLVIALMPSTLLAQGGGGPGTGGSGGGGGPGTGGSGGGGVVPTGSGYLDNPLAFDSITGFLGAVIDIILILAVPIIVFFIIYAGFLYVTAQGNEEKIRKATTAFTWTIVGGLLVLGAWILVEVISGTVDALT